MGSTGNRRSASAHERTQLSHYRLTQRLQAKMRTPEKMGAFPVNDAITAWTSFSSASRHGHGRQRTGAALCHWRWCCVHSWSWHHKHGRRCLCCSQQQFKRWDAATSLATALQCFRPPVAGVVHTPATGAISWHALPRCTSPLALALHIVTRVALDLHAVDSQRWVK